MSNCFDCANLRGEKCLVIGCAPTCYVCDEECGDFEARSLYCCPACRDTGNIAADGQAMECDCEAENRECGQCRHYIRTKPGFGYCAIRINFEICAGYTFAGCQYFERAKIVGASEGDEPRIIQLIRSRLEMGRKQYGALDVHCGKKWRQETMEELLDAIVYIACALMEVRDNGTD